MRRRTFDAIVAAAGLAIAAILVVAGGLLVWGHSFVTNEVHSQLAAQKIFFPAKNSPEITSLPKADAAAMSKWLATEVALTALDHAIQFHGGRGYSKDLPHEQRWRDVRSGMLAHGTAEVMHRVAARRRWPKPGRGARAGR